MHPATKRQRTERDTTEGETQTGATESAADNVPMDYESGGFSDEDSLLPEKKVFNDSVHGHIELHPLLVSIIDTPEFQRLRFIKQLGMCYFVYPGAAHNRFEHSLGVSYLAGELARSLDRKQKHLGITEKDILCVEIAGLCHDLGHGPFSHLFDELFIPRVRKEYKEKHEKLSVDMFEHMLQKNNLREKFRKYDLEERDITFIKEQIVGVKQKQVRAICKYVPTDESEELAICRGEELWVVKRDIEEGYHELRNADGDKGLVSVAFIEDVWPYSGREKNKSFLYEIVANKRNGIDVDKWDYFARDSLYLGISNPFDWRRFLKFARVLNEPDGMQICTRDKEITNLYDMFHTRYTLHRRAYQHRVNKILEAMIVEALVEANDHLLFAGQNGKMYRMSEAIGDMEAYSKMTDHVMWAILSSTDPKLEKSRQLIQRILKRDLFLCIGQTQLKKTVPSTETPMKMVSQLLSVEKDDARKEIYDRLSKTARESNRVAETDILIHVVSFSYGMGQKDPIEHVKFYSKYEPNKTVEVSKIIARDSMSLPREFSERFLRVCIKQRDPQVTEWVGEAFEEWCNDKGLTAKPGEFSAGISWTKKPASTQGRSHAVTAARRLDNMYDSTPLSRNSQPHTQ